MNQNHFTDIVTEKEKNNLTLTSTIFFPILDFQKFDKSKFKIHPEIP